MTIGEYIRQKRKEAGLSAEELGKKIGKNRATIYRYENNSIEKLPANVLVPLANALSITPGELIKRNGDDSPSLPAGTFKPQWKKVPLLGYVAAGRPLEDLNQDVSYVDVEGKHDVNFCVKVVGDSMINIDINDGDIVFVKSTPVVENGQIAVVEIGHEKACLKRFYKNGDTITLVSENPKYSPMVFTEKNCESVEVKGLAVIKQSEIK